MFYISTCRKPVQSTRTLAKWFARLFGGYYENRGKRNLGELLSRAEAKGLSRILFIYERHGNPSEMSVYDSGKGWLSPEIRIKSLVLPNQEAERQRRVPWRSRIVLADDAAKKAAELFEHTSEFREEESLGGVEVMVEKDRLSFSYKGAKVGPVLGIEFREAVAPKEG
ncbi:MAG: hypothetical protein WC792_02540 [Candidatus Micrarchaeia archaeon]|jgi:rRNA maturation protein Rpf1